jgi:hypothetical protein
MPRLLSAYGAVPVPLENRGAGAAESAGKAAFASFGGIRAHHDVEFSSSPRRLGAELARRTLQPELAGVTISEPMQNSVRFDDIRQTFGASAPLKELQRKFGFEPDRVAAAARELL